MSKPVPADVDPEGFDANLEECAAPLRELVAYLRTAAQHAGPAVTSRRYRHATPNSGWGVTYYVDGHRFCELHPKREAGHLWGFIPAADPAALTADGLRPSEQSDWFQVSSMREAVRFVRWILWAHDERQPTPRPSNSVART